MGKNLAAWAQLSRGEQAVKEDKNEDRALANLRREAALKGTTLAKAEKGGLRPSVVLGIMRRDGFRCKRCSNRADLEVHHKGGIPMSPWLRKKGKSNAFNNMVTLCTKCHGEIHQEASDG